MNNSIKFTSSQIRYMIWLSRLSRGCFGVKNVELSSALGLSKPSVHNMLKSLAELEIITQESFGLAHFTDEGRIISQKYEDCFLLIEKKINEVCGENGATELAVCGILADMPKEKIDELFNAQKLKNKT